MICAADGAKGLECDCREKRTQAMRGRNLGRDISVDSAPMVRAVSASRYLPRLHFKAHWTQEFMPQKIHRQIDTQFHLQCCRSETRCFSRLGWVVAKFLPTDSAEEPIIQTPGQ